MLIMGRTLQEILTARKTLIFLLQHLGFVINLKKSVLLPLKQIEFPGLKIVTEKMTLALSEKKNAACVSTMSGVFHVTKTFSLKSRKANWSVVINFTSTNTASTETNISFTEKGVLQWSCDSGEFIQGGTPLAHGKLEIFQ